jgi:hypothetical protein
MRHHAVVIGTLLLLASGTAMAGTVEEQIKNVELHSAKAADSIVPEYAKDGLDAANISITAAKAALAAGMEQEARLQTELAEARLNAAEARAAEKEMVEKVAVRRSELKKAEALLERYRQGEVN